jgi:Ca2+-binding RTX toxin-like protein
MVPMAAQRQRNDLMATIPGTNLRDIINGTSLTDTIFGYGGNDWLRGHGGNDIIRGGSGSDILEGGSGNDVLFADSGSNSLFGGADSDILVSGTGNDHFNGGSGIDAASWQESSFGVSANLTTGRATSGSVEDTFTQVENLIGSRFNDTLSGDAGANGLFGGDGADVLLGGGGNDELSGGAGNDTLDGGAGFNRLHGGVGVDTASYLSQPIGVFVSLARGQAVGDSFDVISQVEAVRGSHFADVIEGDHFGNKLEGMGGNDVIDGGEGNDVLSGGTGADMFVFRASNIDGKASDPFDSGLDSITDFSRSQGDRIDLGSHFEASTFETLRAEASQFGTDTHLRLGDDMIVLDDIALGDLSASMFLF